jgi:tetratricopeptide (TPR) repeat protein
MGIKACDIPDVGLIEIYDVLAKVDYRLARYGEGLEACRYLCHLQPPRGRSYRLLAALHLAAGQLPDAAIADLQSVILGDDDREVVVELSDIYAHLYPRERLFALAAGKPCLNCRNSLVRAHLNQACRGLVQIFLDAKRPADALQMCQKAVQDIGCDQSLFADLLPPRQMASKER